MGGFEEWVRVIGGILHYAGATQWMQNYNSWCRAGDEFGTDALDSAGTQSVMLSPEFLELEG